MAPKEDNEFHRVTLMTPPSFKTFIKSILSCLDRQVSVLEAGVLSHRGEVIWFLVCLVLSFPVLF